MAAVSDCFSIGSIVACTTCFNKNIEGEVLAFDPETKMLILTIYLTSTGGKNVKDIKFLRNFKKSGTTIRKNIALRIRSPVGILIECHSKDSNKLSDVYIVNLSLCSDVQVIKESNTISEPKQSLDLQRLSRRVRNAIEQKKIMVSALQSGVSPEGQKLYMAISKTISNQVNWSGPNIVVFNDVTITPPYKLENVTGSPESRQLAYVKKIVDKFIKDQAAVGTVAGTPPTSSVASSTTVSTVSAN